MWMLMQATSGGFRLRKPQYLIVQSALSHPFSYASGQYKTLLQLSFLSAHRWQTEMLVSCCPLSFHAFAALSSLELLLINAGRSG